MGRLLLDNVCYHIMVRGNQKQAIFRSTDDYDAYLTKLQKYKKKFPFWLYGYCLMPNHIHLIGQPKKRKELPKFMQGLQRSYVAYFNKKYEKVGHLWQGRFKSKVVTKDIYIIDCISYIEQNPCRANLVAHLKDYPFSSYQERISADAKFKLLDELSL